MNENYASNAAVKFGAVEGEAHAPETQKERIW